MRSELQIHYVPVDMTTSFNNTCRNFGLGFRELIRDTTVYITKESARAIESLISSTSLSSSPIKGVDDLHVFCKCEMRTSAGLDVQFCVASGGQVVIDEREYLSTEVRDIILVALGHFE